MEIKITRPEKVLFPDDGITKGELTDYYRRIAPRMLPYLRGRPVTMERHPDGIGKPGFYQQEASRFYPEWITTITVRKEGGAVKHVLCNNTATLVYLANQAAITPHVWLSRARKLNCPDQLVFDLDPSGAEFSVVKDGAARLRELLEEAGLPVFVKTTGSRGLHVVVPLKAREDYGAVRAFARRVAEVLAAREPKRFTLEQRKDKRRGRVFVDINRNAYAQTVAPAYAVRARRGAPVSIPLAWSELPDPGLRPDGCTIRTIFRRLGSIEDPWKDFFHRAASLSGAQRRFEELHAAERISQEEEVRRNAGAGGS